MIDYEQIIIWFFFLGSLGVEALTIARWLQTQQQVDEYRFEEEEILTRYESDHGAINPGDSPSPNLPKPEFKDTDLVGWEFKIVRSHSDLFRNPAVFQRVCQEESESGWVLLEKLDDRRVRFKRPIAFRDRKSKNTLPRFDPYRSYYGPNNYLGLWLGLIGLLIAIILPACLGYALISITMKRSNLQLLTPQANPSLPQTDPGPKP